jgi:hypothetical protein
MANYWWGRPQSLEFELKFSKNASFLKKGRLIAEENYFI